MKTVKCSKGDLLILHNLLGKIPKEKSEKPEDMHKLMNSYRAIKKQLKSYLEANAEVEKRSREKVRSMSKEVDEARALGEQAQSEKDEQKKQALLSQQSVIIENANQQLEPFNKEKEDLNEKIKAVKCEVVFDNEDFLYLESTFKDCARAIFSFQLPTQLKDSKPEERVDLDTMDKIFTIFESVTV